MDDNDSDGSQSKGACTSLKIFVKYPSGKETPCTVEYSNTVLGKTLFEKVEKLSGIPIDMQMLSYKMHLIRPDILLQQLLDECVSCGDMQVMIASLHVVKFVISSGTNILREVNIKQRYVILQQKLIIRAW